MKHIATVSVVRRTIAPDAAREPGFADAKTDFLNSIWQDWWDFVYAKKNEIGAA